MNICWFCFKWGLLLAAAVGGAVGVHLYHQVDEAIRSRIEARFAAHYQGLKVTVRSADLVPGKGLEVRGLAISEPGAEGPRAELLHLEEVQLLCQTDLRELALRDPDITEIVIRRSTLWMTRRPDGTWSGAKLFPWPRLSEHAMTARIENCTIEVFDPLKTPAGTFTLHDVNLLLTPMASPGPGPANAWLRHVEGTVSGDHVRQIVLQGWADLEHHTWNLSGTVDGLDVSPELRACLPDPMAARLTAMDSIHGQGELTFEVQHDPAAATPYQFSAKGRLLRARVEDARLPYPLTDLRANFRFDNQGFAIDDLSARGGQAQLQLSCHAAGFDLAGPIELKGELREFLLERRLREFLPAKLQDQWDKYFPSGQIDADFQLVYDGQRWRPNVQVRCQNISFLYDKFPYRMDYVAGTVTLQDNVVRLNLTAPGGATPLRMTGEITASCAEPPNDWSGWFEAKGEELPLDEKLLGALPERARKVIHSLDPRGTCHFLARLWRERAEEPVHRHLSLGLNRCALRFEHFPYPVTNVRGRMEMFDAPGGDRWTFEELEGTNDTGRFSCTGYLQPVEGGDELSLKILGASVALNQELREALRPNMQQFWDDLHPHGAVDLKAEVHYLSGSNHFSVALQAQPQTENTWIEPAYFPYRLEKLRGLLDYHDGVVTIEHLKAEHGAARAAGAGRCEFRPDGSWLFRLDNLAVSRLLLDRELVQALPGRLRKTLAGLNPAGPINLRGTVEFEHSNQPADPLQSRWDVVVGVQGGSIDCGLKLENVTGEVSLAGSADGLSMRSRGELSLDSLTYKDVQFTQVLGPLWIDDDQVLLGSMVDRRRGSYEPNPGRQPRPLTARLFGGTVYGDAWIALAPTCRYGLQATLSDADLTQSARELAAGRQSLGGKIQATVDLHGTGRSINSLGGHGSIRLRQGDVYELPLMIAMLKILSVRRPDTRAFSQSDIDFRVSGNHVYFDRINFSGDAVSLDGNGEMNFSGQLQMAFHAIIGRNQPRLPLVHEFVGEASQQIMLIHVGGTLQDPQVRNEALPGVNQALQQLGIRD